MKNINKIKIIALFLLGALISCEDQSISSIPLNFGDASTVYSDSTRTVNFINHLYTYIPGGFGRFNNAFLACSTDEAVYAVDGSTMQKWGMGSWSPTVLRDDPMSRCYKGIRNTYVYQNQIHPNLIDGVVGPAGREHFIGQVYFIRALLNFEMLSRYGGYPLLQGELDAKSKIAVARSTYDECVNYIVELCDSASTRLPISVDNANIGRATKGAALALKSRVLLYAASPLYNDASQPEDSPRHGAYSAKKWEVAAKAAAEVINLEENGKKKYALRAVRKPLFNSFISSEIIFNKLSPQNFSLEQQNAPAGLQNGRGGSCPTLELVDAYNTINGLPFDWSNLEMAKDPFKNRDPRFYEDVLYNSATYLDGHVVETYEGGGDTKGIYATKTSFYLRKFMSDNARWWGTTSAVHHSFILYRFAETLLNYAEAMNEAYGPDVDPESYGLTARGAIKLIRERAGLKGNVDLSLTVSTGDKEAMRTAIQSERQVELAYEEHRGYDLRRWKLADKVLNKPVSGLRITPTADGSYNYERITVEKRVFQPQMYYYPFPLSEVNRNSLLEQNEGWGR